jgi:primosomal protein N' (replication factor Y)
VLPTNGFECDNCGSRRLRSAITGSRRTAEEIGRSLPGFPVVTSGAGEVLGSVGSEPAIVIATPGAEPVADGGYAAVLLLDAWASLDLPVLDAPVESLRRWAAAAALVRPGRAVVLCGVPDGVPLPPVEALIRWDPAWLAAREVAERRELGLPPTVRMAQLTGTRRALDEALTQLDLPAGAQALGPMPLAAPRRGASAADGASAPVDQHVLVRSPIAGTTALTKALAALRAFRSARKEAEQVSVRVDPVDSW